MLSKLVWLVLGLSALAGCATEPHAPHPPRVVWHDLDFANPREQEGVAQDDLFALDPKLLQTLREPALQRLSTARRFEKLVALLYGRELKPFPYAPGHSTSAIETWKNKRGDCLSLTVLAFALARELQLDAQMQEVRVPVVFERRDSVDFLSGHVNLLVRASGPLVHTESRLRASDMIIDFEPEVGTNRAGQALTDQAMVARYHNNRGAEFLAQDQRPLAYAHFKAAIELQPNYAPSYGNLALLYRRANFLADAETLLHTAIELSDDATVQLMSLHQLLLAQGRTLEAEHYAQLLKNRRDKDPYYWIGLGLQELRDSKLGQAIQALEKAQRLTQGFPEVHRYLAVAYWRAGDAARANEQLDQLASLHSPAQGIDALRQKFKSPALNR